MSTPKTLALNSEGVTIVQTKAEAERVLEILNSPKVASLYHGCDTEVMDINVKTESPVGHGFVTCLTVYCGPDVDFGNGPNLFVDNLDDAKGMLDLFKPYLENESIKKVWHNYSFDRHVLGNHDINVLGFGGDTMHMARLHNADNGTVGYSLAALTEQYLGVAKVNMKEIFKRAKLKKDGTPSATATELPPVEDLQRGAEWREDWIQYACRDARVTWLLRQELQELLKLQVDPAVGTMWETQYSNMWEFYDLYTRPFGAVLTDMEREGFYINNKHLAEVEILAEADKLRYEQSFKEWVKTKEPNAQYMNIASTAQKQQLFFAPFKKGKKTVLEKERVFTTENTDEYIEPGKTKPAKTRPFTITGLGLPAVSMTATGTPQCNAVTLKILAGDLDGLNPKYGVAYHHFLKEDGHEKAVWACTAIDALTKVAGTNTMLGTFIKPLQTNLDKNGRVHSALNMNTTTGRLSSRRPNLQNQPAVEKDVYKVRAAFCAEPGNTLIVADYGQLELRVLAHMSQCQSMIEAFSLGGDFHSRTAMGMFPYINEAVQNGDVLLEWNYADGPTPTKPLLKDIYGSERQKAKILNFSIAYGKTVHGLSHDFGVSQAEAKRMLEAWYNDRPEVLELQEHIKAFARQSGYTTTLMGRRRPLPTIRSKQVWKRFAAERAAINTPIQGGAADIVMAAMLRLSRSERFKEIGWRSLLQVHDEIIAEGPIDTEPEAMLILKDCMEHPFEQPLLVDLTVDAASDFTWYDAK